MLLSLETHFPSSSLLVSFWKQLCWYILITQDSLLCKRCISASCPVELILFDLIMFSNISLNLSIIATTRFIFDQEEILSICHNCPAWAKYFPFAIKTLEHESMWMFVPSHLLFLNHVMHGQLDYVLMVHISIVPLCNFCVFDGFY